jgi:hypothetical protein
MHDICTYYVKVHGQVDEKVFNAASPLQMTVVRVHADEKQSIAATLFTVRTDQSGLVGLIRHLHQQGFVLLSLCREQ